jgi:hypothetical protein
VCGVDDVISLSQPFPIINLKPSERSALPK